MLLFDNIKKIYFKFIKKNFEEYKVFLSLHRFDKLVIQLTKKANLVR